MARLAFLDRMPWDYRVDTPYRQPLGGSQSALCYLAAALASQGHAVTTVTQTKSPGHVLGVECRSAAEGGYELFKNAEIVIVLNDPDPVVAASIRREMGPKGIVLLWTQHDVDQPAMAPFADVATRAAWDGVVLVSEWQRQAYVQAFNLVPAHSVVFGNAVAPAFSALFDEKERVLQAKAGTYDSENNRGMSARLAYTSTPFRGLDVLLLAFPLVRMRHPEANLLVHSSLSVYQVPRDEDAYGDLYARCHAMLGVEYRGSIPQPELAHVLKDVRYLVYPSTFPETFCTSVLEAMAAGCIAIVGELGALPETTLGMAELVEPSTDQEVYARRFADRINQMLTWSAANPEALADRLEYQVRTLRERATWSARASEWSRWIGELLSPRNP